MLVNVVEYLKATLSRGSSKVALIDDRETITFDQLDARSDAVAAAIARHQVGNCIPICVLLPRSAEMVVMFLGILKSGNIYVPLDPKSPFNRLKAVVDTIHPGLIIAEDEQAVRLKESGVDAPILTLSDAKAAPLQSADASIHQWTSQIDCDPAYIICTSGSTGIPKGVAISHRSIIDYIEWARECFAIGCEDVIGNQAPFVFDNSTLDIYLCLSTGATLVVVPESNFAFPPQLIGCLNKHQITTVFWVPSVLISISQLRALDGVSLPYLRTVLFAGEVMPNLHLNYWRQQLPGAAFANLYGPTEITVDCTYFIVDRPFEDSEPLPIGFPCRNSSVFILDDNDAEVAPGEIGELCVRGTSLALGYWNDPQRTEEAFCQNPLQAHYPERIYRTGDLVRTNERGELLFLGRKDSQIKRHGYRIELGEIEQAAFRVEGILNTCVLYDELKSDIVMLYSVTRELSPEDVRRQLSEYLPRYMLPSRLHEVAVLPLNENGKVDRKRLKAQYA